MRNARFVFAALYFVVAYGILFAYGDRRYFCSPTRTGHSYALTTARLALACTFWNIFAGVVGIRIAKLARGQITRPGLVLLVSTVIAGTGFVSIPFWIYRGNGIFLLDHTWAEVSCFFAEGFGKAFPFVVAPMLTAATLLEEWLISRARARVMGQVS
jgi:hypothetical protein